MAGCRPIDRRQRAFKEISGGEQLVEVCRECREPIHWIEWWRLWVAFDRHRDCAYGVGGAGLIAGQARKASRWAAMGLRVRIAACAGPKPRRSAAEHGGARLSTKAQEHQDHGDQMAHKHGASATS